MSSTVNFGPASTSTTPSKNLTPEPSLRIMLEESSVTGPMVSKMLTVITKSDFTTFIYEFVKLLSVHDLAFRNTEEEKNRAQKMIDARDRRMKLEKNQDRYSNAYKVSGSRVRETLPSDEVGASSTTNSAKKRKATSISNLSCDELQEKLDALSSNDDENVDNIDLFSDFDFGESENADS